MEVAYRKGNMGGRGMCPWLLQAEVDGGFAYSCLGRGKGAEAHGVLCFLRNTHHVRCEWYVNDGEVKL